MWNQLCKNADLGSKMTNNCNMLAYLNSKNGEVRMKGLRIIALSNMAGSIQQSINSPFAWEGNPFCDITSMHAQGTNALSTAVATWWWKLALGIIYIIFCHLEDGSWTSNGQTLHKYWGSFLTIIVYNSLEP